MKIILLAIMLTGYMHGHSQQPISKQILTYPNGQAIYSGKEVNGVKEGEWIEYNYNGHPLSKGVYKNGKEDGEWVYYFASPNISKIHSTCFYIDGKKWGEQLTYFFDTGTIGIRENYIKGILTGDYITYFDDETIASKGSFSNGKEQGEWIFYTESGFIFLKENYNNGLLDGEFIVFYHNSLQIQERCIYVNTYTSHTRGTTSTNAIGGTQTGEHITYYPNGKVKHTENYENGRVKGYVYDFHENGQLRKKLLFDGQTPQGEVIIYNEQGQIITKGFYNINGWEDGEWTWYYDSGQIMKQGKYKAQPLGGPSLRVGQWIEYSPNGTIMEISTY